MHLGFATIGVSGVYGSPLGELDRRWLHKFRLFHDLRFLCDDVEKSLFTTVNERLQVEL